MLLQGEFLAASHLPTCSYSLNSVLVIISSASFFLLVECPPLNHLHELIEVMSIDFHV